MGKRVSRSNSTIRAARDLFFKYDGSTFYMSRDGADREYQSYAVPKDLEREWLRELTVRHLAALDKPGNWWTLNFLVHQRDTNHLERVIAAPPLGELWQRTAYLELMLQYISACQSAGASRARIASALEFVQKHANHLLKRSRSEASRVRVARVIEEAERRGEKLDQYLKPTSRAIASAGDSGSRYGKAPTGGIFAVVFAVHALTPAKTSSKPAFTFADCLS